MIGKLGGHYNFRKDIYTTIKKGIKDGGEIIQIMLNSGTNYGFETNINIEKVKKLLNNKKLVIHSPYIINLSKINEKQINYLIKELNLINKIKGVGTVVHIGKMNKNLKNSIKIMKKNIELIINNSEGGNLILETASGQKNELLTNLNDLKNFYNLFDKNIKTRLKICIDTCHIFQANYKLTKSNIKKMYKLFKNELILIQLNDSVYSIGMKKDRHANIGEGYIGKSRLLWIYNYFIKKNIDIVMETPIINYKFFKF